VSQPHTPPSLHETATPIEGSCSQACNSTQWNCLSICKRYFDLTSTSLDIARDDPSSWSRESFVRSGLVRGIPYLRDIARLKYGVTVPSLLTAGDPNRILKRIRTVFEAAALLESNNAAQVVFAHYALCIDGEWIEFVLLCRSGAGIVS